MKTRINALSLMAVALCAGVQGQAFGGSLLGSAENFGVLGGSTVTNTGLSVISGELGVWPGIAVTGFPPGIVNGGSIHLGDAVAQQAQSDVTVAYNTLVGMPVDQVLTGVELGGTTLTPGVYFFASSAGLTGTLTLDAQGDPLAEWVFQIGSTLTTAAGSAVVMTDGGVGSNVYWQIGSSATIGANTALQGNMLALASITMGAEATILDGRALARNGAVTLSTNTIGAGTPPAPCPWDCQAVPDGIVGINDLLDLLAQWGGPGPCDFHNGSLVGAVHLKGILANWGRCP